MQMKSDQTPLVTCVNLQFLKNIPFTYSYRYNQLGTYNIMLIEVTTGQTSNSLAFISINRYGKLNSIYSTSRQRNIRRSKLFDTIKQFPYKGPSSIPQLKFSAQYTHVPSRVPFGHVITGKLIRHFQTCGLYCKQMLQIAILQVGIEFQSYMNTRLKVGTYKYSILLVSIKILRIHLNQQHHRSLIKPHIKFLIGSLSTKVKCT